MKITEVTEIQVAGGKICNTLGEACREYVRLLNTGIIFREKIHFMVKLKDGSTKYFTVRDDDGETVVYGDFEGLSSFFEYAKSAIPPEYWNTEWDKVVEGIGDDVL